MDEFSDDDFDELNDTVLQELETKAIQLTQAQKTTTQQPQYIDDYDDDDLDDGLIDDQLLQPSILPPEKPASSVSTSRIIPQQTNHNTWGPVPIPASHLRQQPVASASRPSAPVPLASRPSQAPIYSQIRPPLPPPRPPPSVQSRYQASQVQRPAPPPNHELATLQIQIRDLTARLQNKDGEIGIVRNRLEKTRQDHERELQALKKQTAEQLANQQRAVEAAKVAERTATTELEFTRRDLKEELARAKRKDKDGPSTPKKNAAARSWGIADGFDDVEMAASPSKGNRGRNVGAVASVVPEPPARLTRTPTKGRRKRPAATLDSPVMELETTEDAMEIDAPPGNVAEGNNVTVPPIKPLPFDFLKVILNHSAAYGRPLTFDVLAGYALPSKKTESLASILFQKLAIMGDPYDPMRLPIEFCEQVMDLLQRCLKENCLEPISELLSLVSFTLHLNTVAIAPHVVQGLLDIAATSCAEISIPRLTNPTMGDPTDEKFNYIKANIPITDILSVMYLVALGCATAPPAGGSMLSPIMDFWNNVHVKFVAMLLSPRQPVDHVVAMLKLLRTAVFEEAIGPIAPSESADEIARVVIDRVTLNLVETYRRDVDYDTSMLLKATVLRTLAAFGRSPYGMRQLAQHEWAIPRLVYLLSCCIDELYDGDTYSHIYIPSSSSSPPSAERPKQPEATQRVNDLQMLIVSSVLLLHAIITNKENASTMDPKTKLAKMTGGNQKYLLSLARLNFAEDGVSEETADLARELLEQLVTEEEGSELTVFFGGG